MVKMVKLFEEKARELGWSKERKQKELAKIMVEVPDIKVPRGQLIGITSWEYGCEEGVPGIPRYLYSSF